MKAKEQAPYGKSVIADFFPKPFKLSDAVETFFNESKPEMKNPREATLWVAAAGYYKKPQNNSRRRFLAFGGVGPLYEKQFKFLLCYSPHGVMSGRYDLRLAPRHRLLPSRPKSPTPFAGEGNLLPGRNLLRRSSAGTFDWPEAWSVE